MDEADAAAIADRPEWMSCSCTGRNARAGPTGVRVWKAFRVTSGLGRERDGSIHVEAFLLDGPAPGTGEAFDWRRAAGSCRISFWQAGSDRTMWPRRSGR